MRKRNVWRILKVSNHHWQLIKNEVLIASFSRKRAALAGMAVEKRRHERKPNSPAQNLVMQLGFDIRQIRGTIAHLEALNRKFPTVELRTVNLAMLKAELENCARERFETLKAKLIKNPS